jgi:hypothetical protein
VAVVAFAVGALPWIWSNARSRLGSFATGEFTDHRPYVGYAGRLGLFFQHVLPMDLGLDRMDGGHRFFGVDHALVELVFLSVLVAAVALCIRRGGSALALAAGVVAFPFVYAPPPGPGRTAATRTSCRRCWPSSWPWGPPRPSSGSGWVAPPHRG